MAIFHLSVKTVSRSAGRSAVAAAAYRMGERLYDQRCGLEHDYTRKGGVAETFTLVPEGAEWAQDRQALWNAAEKAELRKNSTVGREYELALPAELSKAQRSALVRAFGQELVDRYGVAVDVGIHAPERSGDQRNFHAHVLTTTRQVGPEGLGEKTRILDAKATGPGEVEKLRASWANHLNQALERVQSPERVDHRSYERQGLDRTPTTHLGPLVAGLERRAMAEQGVAPERPMGLLEAMARPEFQPVTERGRGNVMAALSNRIRDWSRSAEQALERGVEVVRQVAGGVEKALGKVPGLGQVAALFRQEQQAGLSASLASPSVQRGLADSAQADQAAKEAERRRELELKREISLERKGPSLSR